MDCDRAEGLGEVSWAACHAPRASREKRLEMGGCAVAVGSSLKARLLAPIITTMRADARRGRAGQGRAGQAGGQRQGHGVRRCLGHGALRCSVLVRDWAGCSEFSWGGSRCILRVAAAKDGQAACKPRPVPAERARPSEGRAWQSLPHGPPGPLAAPRGAFLLDRSSREGKAPPLAPATLSGFSGFSMALASAACGRDDT